MIVIGVDVHKLSLTAVAVDEVGRPLGERTCAVDDGVVEWAQCLVDGERLWALEDCRHVTRGLEQAACCGRAACAGTSTVDGFAAAS